MGDAPNDMPLRTPRLTVRLACPDDWRAYQAIVASRQSDPELWYTDHQWNLSDGSMRDALIYLSGTGEWYTVCPAGSDEPLGYFCMGVHGDCAELGYAFAVAARGRGYATEAGEALLKRAFERLGVSSVEAGTAAHNVRSRKLLGRLGFSVVESLEVSFTDGPDGRPMKFTGVRHRLTLEEWVARGAAK